MDVEYHDTRGNPSFELEINVCKFLCVILAMLRNDKCYSSKGEGNRYGPY